MLVKVRAFSYIQFYLNVFRMHSYIKPFLVLSIFDVKVIFFNGKNRIS